MTIPNPPKCGLPDKFDKWRPQQEDALLSILNNQKRATEICMPTGGGKCYCPTTLVMMFDGTTKPISEVRSGDLVMGPDSQPRTVGDTHAGSAFMYRINPTKGKYIDVSEGHILSIYLTRADEAEPERYMDIPIEQYIVSTPTFKHRAKLYRSDVLSFPIHNTLSVDPYYLGLWLGDGTTRSSDITTADSEIVEYLHRLAKSNNLAVVAGRGRTGCPTYKFHNGRSFGSGNPNPVAHALRGIGVIGNKHIPHEYKTSSVEDRRSLIAGLIDSDGYYHHGYLEITQKVRRLAFDLNYVCRSLGLAAYTNLCEKSDQHGKSGIYYRTHISGDLSRIPTILPRKQAEPRLQKKSVQVTGFSIEPLGVGKYSGFSIVDMDKHFLLGDFTVGHNSAIVVGAAVLSNRPTCIVTSTKGLQKQYLDTFSNIGMVDIRGRNNYTCSMREDYTCEQGAAARCPYSGGVGCPSSLAEIKATTSKLVVTNYSKWCAAKLYGTGMDHFTQVVFDEFHDAPNALAAAMQVNLNHKEIEETLGVPFLTGTRSETFANWKPWASATKCIAEDAMVQAKARITGVSDPKAAWVRHYTHMRNLVRRLSTLSLASAADWIAEETKEGFVFDPVRPAKYAESALLFRIPKIIAVSATIRPKTMFMVGIGQDNFTFKEYDSSFDPDRCPIYYIPTQRVDSKHPDNSMLWLKHDQIAAKRRDRKGLVHTISHDRRAEIMATSRFSSSMIFNDRGEPAAKTIEDFIASPVGTELVSPCIGTGYDFKGKMAEWQFICRIPFEPPSKIVKAREEVDREYRSYRAMQQLVQMCGRLMRDDKDRGESFICDMNMDWFYPQNKHHAPKSFNKFLQKVATVPPPPPALSKESL